MLPVCHAACWIPLPACHRPSVGYGDESGCDPGLERVAPLGQLVLTT